MRILFCGSGTLGLSTLAKIPAAGHELVGVVSQPPRPAGRGGWLTTPTNSCPVPGIIPSEGTASVPLPQTRIRMGALLTTGGENVNRARLG